MLALAATLLPAVVLWGFAEEHASIANRGYPVVALWVGVQLVAVVLAELTGRVVFWWLEPRPGSAPDPTGRDHDRVRGLGTRPPRPPEH